MDLKELFQFSIDTNAYGKLFFEKFDESNKKPILDEIIKNKNTDEEIFESVFLKTFLNSKNKYDCNNIDFAKISFSEKQKFAEIFFIYQFLEYKYDLNISWKENIFKAEEFEEQQIIEQAKLLSNSVGLNFSALKQLRSPYLSMMKEVNNSITKLYDKEISVSNYKESEFQLPRNYILEEIYGIEDKIDSLSKNVLKLNTLTNATNEIQKKHLETYIKNIDEQTKQNTREGKITKSIAIIAIIIPLVFDIFINLYNFHSDSNSYKENILIEKQKIELLKEISNKTDYESVIQIIQNENKILSERIINFEKFLIEENNRENPK